MRHENCLRVNTFLLSLSFKITSPGVRNKSSKNEESLRLQQKEDTNFIK